MMRRENTKRHCWPRHTSSKDMFYEAATQPLDKQVVSALHDLTTDLVDSGRWHEYRVRRLTASKGYQVIRKIKEEVRTSNNAFLKQIMNFVSPANSPASR